MTCAPTTSRRRRVDRCHRLVVQLQELLVARAQQLGQALARPVTLVDEFLLQRRHAAAQRRERGEAADHDTEDDEEKRLHPDKEACQARRTDTGRS